MPMRAASSFVRRRLLRWGPTGMALSLSVAASPTYSTPRYETACAAYTPRQVGLLTVDNIAFANCGKSIEVSQNSTEPPKVREREGGTGIRIVKKLAAGGLGGLVGGGLGATFALMTFGPVDVYFGFQGGTIVGAAVGVNGVGTQDNFRRTLAGSALAGVAVPSALRENPRWKGREGLLAWSVLLSPVVGATIASELWRKPLSAKLHLKPEVRRVSVGLVPNPKGGLSAIATLRF